MQKRVDDVAAQLLVGLGFERGEARLQAGASGEEDEEIGMGDAAFVRIQAELLEHVVEQVFRGLAGRGEGVDECEEFGGAQVRADDALDEAVNLLAGGTAALDRLDLLAAEEILHMAVEKGLEAGAQRRGHGTMMARLGAQPSS